MLINLLGFEFGPEIELVKVSLLFSSVTLAPENVFVCLFLGSLSLFFGRVNFTASSESSLASKLRSLMVFPPTWKFSIAEITKYKFF